MKKSFNKILLLSLFVMLAFIARGQQQDYVITATGDTLLCKVTTPIIGASKYKAGGMADAVKVDPAEIKEYYIARKTLQYRSVFIDSSARPVFLQVIENGSISLYQQIYTHYNGMATTSTTTWFVGKGSNHVSDLKTSGLFLGKGRQKRKDEFGEMIMDNKLVYDKYKAEDKFSFKQIQDLVHLYNTGRPLFDPGKPKDPD